MVKGRGVWVRVEKLVVILCQLNHPHDNEDSYIQEMLFYEHQTDFFAYTWPVESSECENNTIQGDQYVN